MTLPGIRKRMTGRLLFRPRFGFFFGNGTAFPAVLRRKSLAHLRLALGFQFFGRTEAIISLPVVEKLPKVFFIDIKAFALPEKLPIPVQTEPFEALQHILLMLLLGTLLISVLYPQKEFTPLMAGKKPIKKRCPGIPEAERTRGTAQI